MTNQNTATAINGTAQKAGIHTKSKAQLVEIIEKMQHSADAAKDHETTDPVDLMARAISSLETIIHLTDVRTDSDENTYETGENALEFQQSLLSKAIPQHLYGRLNSEKKAVETQNRIYDKTFARMSAPGYDESKADEDKAILSRAEFRAKRAMFAVIAYKGAYANAKEAYLKATGEKFTPYVAQDQQQSAGPRKRDW